MRQLHKPLFLLSLYYETKIDEMLFAYHVDLGHVKAKDQQQQQNVFNDSTMESTPSSSLGKNLMNEDDLKASYAMGTSVC